jgi:hypothetical protein
MVFIFNVVMRTVSLLFIMAIVASKLDNILLFLRFLIFLETDALLLIINFFLEKKIVRLSCLLIGQIVVASFLHEVLVHLNIQGLKACKFG